MVGNSPIAQTLRVTTLGMACFAGSSPTAQAADWTRPFIQPTSPLPGAVNAGGTVGVSLSIRDEDNERVLTAPASWSMLSFAFVRSDPEFISLSGHPAVRHSTAVVGDTVAVSLEWDTWLFPDGRYGAHWNVADASGNKSVFSWTPLLADGLVPKPRWPSFPVAVDANDTGHPDGAFTGPPDRAFGEMAAGSQVTFDFGFERRTWLVSNGDGPDLTLYEADKKEADHVNREEFASIDVLVSLDGQSFASIKHTEGHAIPVEGDADAGLDGFARSYDLAGWELARYVRIEARREGFDLDGIAAVNYAWVPLPPALAFLGSALCAVFGLWAVGARGTAGRPSGA